MISRRAPRSARRAKEAERAADPAAARSAAVALLARRDFASGELHARLTARGFTAPAATEALLALAAQGVLSDERYAHNFVAYHAGRGQGPIRIAAELRARGLAQSLIEAALASGSDWRALAGAARIRRFGKAAPASWKEKARQARFLQYRGFSADHIRAATGTDPDTD
ncbi:MAG: regulatory protein RecX [Steroidobacteraceae bacterium]